MFYLYFITTSIGDEVFDKSEDLKPLVVGEYVIGVEDLNGSEVRHVAAVFENVVGFNDLTATEDLNDLDLGE